MILSFLRRHRLSVSCSASDASSRPSRSSSPHAAVRTAFSVRPRAARRVPLRLLLSLVGLLCAFAAFGQSEVEPEPSSVEGCWSGTLSFGGERLRVLFRFTPAGTGWRATMDSPDQGVRGIPVDSVSVSPLGVQLAVPQLRLRFSGGRFGRDLLSGMLTQGDLRMALVLRRGEERPARPQEPQPPFPYRCEEVAFTGRDGAVTLHGTLTLPAGEGPFPALVLVTGSGTQNRDEECFGHKPFLLLADCLTRRGVAVLRYDDRGYGASAEELSRLRGSTTLDLAEDALGAFDCLRSHAAIDPERIGIGGHSEGGTIAFIAAAREPRVAFVVSLAGMIVRGSELLVEQNRAGLCAAGVPSETAEAYARALERLYDAWMSRSPEELAAQCDRLVAEATAGETLPEPLRRNLAAVVGQARNPWFDRFVRYDPAEAVAALGGRPCLALNGTKDLQVDAERNLGRLERLTAGNPQVRILRCEGLNHLFQPCTTGAVSEYGRIETTIAPEVLAVVADWLQRFVAR